MVKPGVDGQLLSSEDAWKGWANLAVTTSIFGWKLTFVLLNFSVVRFKLTSIGLQPAEDPTDDLYPRVYEQSIDRLTCVSWAARPCYYHLRSNIYPARWLVTTDG